MQLQPMNDLCTILVVSLHLNTRPRAWILNDTRASNCTRMYTMSCKYGLLHITSSPLKKLHS